MHCLREPALFQLHLRTLAQLHRHNWRAWRRLPLASTGGSFRVTPPLATSDFKDRPALKSETSFPFLLRLAVRPPGQKGFRYVSTKAYEISRVQSGLAQTASETRAWGARAAPTPEVRFNLSQTPAHTT